MKKFIEKHFEETLELVRGLCAIPAPSHHEEARAAFCRKWLLAAGAKEVWIDEALNVICPLGDISGNALTVVAAHTDTVFPDTEPMPLREDAERIYCPGVGDDTASVAVLMMTVKYLLERNFCPRAGMLFVCNSCEEGLGNLKGTRRIFEDYAGRVARFLTLDANLGYIADQCVGSRRYEVTVGTPGGHSFAKFGNPNAIAELAKIIRAIYALETPQFEGGRTTYNVGLIEGGTSVNTIAQQAKMLCEYRSNDRRALAVMRERFRQIFEEANAGEVKVTVKTVGERPCAGDVDPGALARLLALCAEQTKAVTGRPPIFKSSSTDCNIPLSLGVPAVCIGVFAGAGAHTREEYIEKASLRPGLELAIRIVLKLEESSRKEGVKA